MSKSKYSLQISKKIIKQKGSPDSLGNKPPLKQNQTQIQFFFLNLILTKRPQNRKLGLNFKFGMNNPMKRKEDVNQRGRTNLEQTKAGKVEIYSPRR